MNQARTFFKRLQSLKPLLPEELSGVTVQKIKLMTHTKAIVKFCKACEKCTLPRLVTELELQAGFNFQDLLILIVDSFSNDAYDGLSGRIKSTDRTCACTAYEYEAHINYLHSYTEE